MTPRSVAEGLLLCVAFCACAPTETGNPGARATLRLSAYSSDASVAEIGASSGAIGVFEAWIALGPLRFVPCDGADRELVPEQPSVELVGETGELPVPAGDFCAIELALSAATSGEPPAVLADRSAALSGETLEGVPFVIGTSSALEISLGPNASSIAIEEDAVVILGFDVAIWLAGIDLASAVPDADGSITIDEASNASLLDHFVAQGPAAASLHHDADGDGHLQPEEIADPVANHN